MRAKASITPMPEWGPGRACIEVKLGWSPPQEEA